MKKEGEYYIGESGCRWSTKRFSKEEAEQAEKTCENCTDCTDCVDCKDCVNCKSCDRCTACVGCIYNNDLKWCNNCSNCINCENSNKCDKSEGCISCTSCFGCRSCKRSNTLRNCRECERCANCRNSYGLTDCTNCMSCSTCHECVKCENSEDCISCKNCNHCWNCRECEDANGGKDCKNCKAIMRCEHCKECRECKHCIDCERCEDCYGECENCKECKKCVKCTNCRDCKECNVCRDCGECKRCVNCMDCEKKEDCKDYHSKNKPSETMESKEELAKVEWPLNSIKEQTVSAVVKVLLNKKGARVDEAPAQSLAQKWIREVLKIDIEIYRNKTTEQDHKGDYSAVIIKDGEKQILKNFYECYELALEEALETALSGIAQGEEVVTSYDGVFWTKGKYVNRSYVEIADGKRVLHWKYAVRISDFDFNNIPLMKEISLRCEEDLNEEEIARVKLKEEKEKEDPIWKLGLEVVGNNRIEVVKTIREIFNIGLKEAKDIADKAPCVIKSNMKKEDAEVMANELKKAGALVSLIRKQ